MCWGGGENALTGTGNGFNDAIGTDLADAVIAGVYEIKRAVGGERHCLREIQCGRCRRAAVAGEAKTTVAGEKCDVSIENAAHGAPVTFSDEESAVGCDNQAARIIEINIQRRTRFGGGSSASGEACDDAVGVDAEDTAVETVVTDEDIALAVGVDSFRVAELGACRRAVEIGEAGLSVAGERIDVSVGADAADAVILVVGDVQITGRVEGDAEGIVDARLAGESAVAAKSGRAGAGNGSDDSVGVDLADAVLLRFRKVDDAARVDGDAPGVDAGGKSGGAVIGVRAAAGDGGDDAGAINTANFAAAGGDYQ